MLATLLTLPLRLLTFDLDDTLFPCAPVVARANAALGVALSERGAPGLDGKAIQDRMKVVRAQLEAKVTYTELRTLGIESLLTDTGAYESAKSEAAACFDVWLDERQAAANDLLYPGAAGALGAIRAAQPQVLIGAVTNGRGDPREMPALAGVFDFYLSGEEEGVFPSNKPAPLFYAETLQRARRVLESRDGSMDAAECIDALRASWVHVGDSLVNDVAASNAAGAETVWLCHRDDVDAPAFSTVSPKEAARRAAAAEAVLNTGCVGTTIEAIAELPTALEELLTLRGGSVAQSLL